MSILRKLAGQTAIYGLSSILGRLLNYLLVPLYTRVFDTAEYGVVTQFYAFAAFLNILFTYGLETAYFRFSQTEKDASKVYSTALFSIVVSSVGLFILLSLTAPFSTTLFVGGGPMHEQIPMLIVWFAGILTTDAIAAIPFARLRQENKAFRFAVIRLANILLNIGFNLFFLVGCPAWWAAGADWMRGWYDPTLSVGYVFLANLIASCITLLLLLPQLRPLASGADKSLLKKMLRYGWPLMIAGFAGMVNETFDRIMLPLLVSDPSTAMDQLGVYGACYKLSILMTLFVQTFRYAADPFFFSQAGNEDAKFTYSRVLTWFVAACAFIFLGVMLYMDVVQHFIGEKFRSGLAVVPILLLANLCLGVYLNVSIWYKLSGKTVWGAWFSVVGAIITLALNFLLIPSMGYMGAAWATLICYAAIMILSYLVGQRQYPVPYDIAAFFYAIGGALVLWGASVFLAPFLPSFTIKMIVHTLLLLAYGAAAWSLLRLKSRKFARS
ncbi:MAG: oligosaccharide flippase family protein [Bacteroidota bacterium]